MSNRELHNPQLTGAEILWATLPNRELRLNVPVEGIAKRLATWKAPEPRYKRGVFVKYTNSVSSASEGAVTT